MTMLSIGMPSTLGSYKALCDAVFGPDSAQARFINDKIATQGVDEEVIADESQMLYLLMSLGDKPSHDLEDLLS